MTNAERGKQLKDRDRITVEGSSVVPNGEYELEKESEETLATTKKHRLVSTTFKVTPVEKESE